LWLLVQNETLIQRSAEQEETRELQEMKLQWEVDHDLGAVRIDEVKNFSLLKKMFSWLKK
jgi:hypothetical protein